IGDKMSPMSDTPNYAAGIGEIPIFEHIRHMMGTTIPAMLITVVLFYFLGLSESADTASTDDIQHVITGIKHAANLKQWA
ncbi:Na+/H+ antiporter NhaC, partial [Bacillus vallismortis]|nr:Na+/H+ antiporter NhaC [Bacillus vallismortis]